MTKKFNYKLPSMVALTLFGTAFTAHHAHAAENTQDQTNNKNVLDDQTALKQAEQAKEKVSQPAQNVSGTQTYQDPTKVQSNDDSTSNTYDASLDELNDSSSKTSQDQSNNSTQKEQQTQDANETTSNTEVANTQDADNENSQSEQQAQEATNSSTKEDLKPNNSEDASQPDQQNSESISDKNEVTSQSKEATQPSNTDNSSSNDDQQVNNQSTNDQDTAQTQGTKNKESDATQSSSNQVDDDENNETTVTTSSNSDEQTTKNSNHQQSSDEKTEQSSTKVSNTNKSGYNFDYDDDTTEDTDTTDVQDLKSNGAKSQTTRATNDKQPQIASLTAQAKDDNSQKPKTESNNTKNNEITNKTTTPSVKATNNNATTRSNQSTNEKATSSNNKKVTTFGSVTKPRMMYSVNKKTTSKATSSLPKYTPQVKSSINDYIRKNNFKAPQIEENYTSYFPKYGYRYGVGRPEGIVVHDTANDNSTIDGEINFMKNNYESAFVHAFVDGNRIIETAPTDYLSWGAGPAGNERFINVEIVHTHDYASFARSMNNYADYAATQLVYYGLKPDSAENDGQGTVWTHYAISRWLGGTDHADPHQYFRDHNYSYAELYDLINEKYLIKTGQVAPWGTTSSSSTKPSGGSSSSSSSDKLTVSANSGVAQIKPSNSGLYTTVYDSKGHSTDQAQKTLSVTKSATLGNNKFYLVEDYNSGKKYGWVKQSDVVYNTAKSPVKVNETYNIKPGVKLYTVPWGTFNQEASKVSGSGNQTFKATKKQQIDKAIYLYGTVNGKSGWVSKYYLTAPTQSKAATNTKVTTANRAASTQSTPKATQSATTQTINKIAQVKANNSGIRTSVYDKKAKSGAKYANRTFIVSKQRTEGNNTYVLLQDGTQNTPLGWVNIKDVTSQNIGKQTKSSGQYKVNSSNDGLYSIAWGTKNQQLLPSNMISNKSFKASKSVYVGKELFLYGTVNSRTGWVAAKDLTQNGNDTQATPYHYTFVVNNNKGYYYNDFANNAHYSLNSYYNQPFIVSKQMQVNGVTWYYGQLTNGKYVWIKPTDLSKESIKYVRTGMTLTKAANIQNNSYYNPQVQRTAGKWEDANYDEIKNAMDPVRLAKDDEYKYQFLLLDQPQYLPVSALNKLLEGKGVLEGQGASFSQAAKKYGINEIYLISHALIETGNGTSDLAKGGDIVNGKFTNKSAKKYHNVFGIGAYDNNPLVEGIKYAKEAGWDSVSKAIIGGAKFIGQSYVKAGQNTLYKMRWNPAHPGTHQYATDINWANLNAQVIKGFYDKMGEVGKYFEIPQYNK
ncbi:MULTISPECIES: glucosaminidase domain-containing protein [Staphylococcus]|uniref:glucosaminidase domain-containing protein n=1 Tax=Staphylococcus TaxID=1279 RepID=UPI0002EF6785|nr:MULTISPECIES: glucosaminidase domain-containing protein [Staphylococcus]MBC3071058.1 glucosaminidase domain-containing protein [Staphylococcus capitis]MBC3081435.1 glucosaminidase domain-containing protein [Staphylococcus capitis]MBO0371303.1 glucosaminidase domain-containing protein [Staphylococcus capitis]MBO0375059.1 glucosaminidase domain-containing protein [Staphylococcus capitis]MCI2953060.1 glucosaminidase domain-containing protein [Staphylococcus capitis]